MTVLPPTAHDPVAVRAAAGVKQPSVRRRLLLFLLVPTLSLVVATGASIYFIALGYSNYVHDRDLALSTTGLARAIVDNHADGRLSADAIRLIEFNPDGRSFFAVRSRRHGIVSGSGSGLGRNLPETATTSPFLYDAVIDSARVRAASLVVASPPDPDDQLVVSMAETFEDREQQAREILLITIPVEALLILALLALVWQGVRFGLHSLDPPVRRLAARGRDLAPISGPDIPVEILPLTRAIDALFERVRSLVAIEERFVADAAHQLRTPLAGLSMHVERALDSRNAEDTQDALRHIQRSTARVTRSATQLLALARLQVPGDVSDRIARLDLAKWLPDVVAQRIPDALRNRVDLGYDDESALAVIEAEAASLQELIDNLIDNALAHVARGGIVTVSLRNDDTDRVVCIAVDDDGPGVPLEMWPRLGERFFRAPGAAEGGSGLGLAIVKRIADVHGAGLRFGRSGLGGLRVELEFPRATERNG